MVSRLFEQIIRGNRVYYHGSPHDFDEFKPSNRHSKGDAEPTSFFSTNYKFAVDYAKYAANRDPESVVYTCKLTHPYNLFNPASPSDVARIEAITTGGEEDWEVRNALFEMVSCESRLRNWNSMETPALTKKVKHAGFDGYNTVEGKIENIALFDPSDVKILKKEKLEDIMSSVGEVIKLPFKIKSIYDLNYSEIKEIAYEFTQSAGSDFEDHLIRILEELSYESSESVANDDLRDGIQRIWEWAVTSDESSEISSPRDIYLPLYKSFKKRGLLV
jgi:hypothetical protein